MMFCNRLSENMRKIHLLSLSLLVFIVHGCLNMNWPPPVNSQKDIKRLKQQTGWIRGRGLSDSDIPELARITGAFHVDFSGGMAAIPLKITDDGLRILSELNLTNVQIVGIGFNNHITDAGIEHLVKMNIKELYLRACQSITDEGIRSLAEMDSLGWLDIGGCPEVTDQGLKYLAESESLGLLMVGRAYANPKMLKRIEEINGINLSQENQISVEGLKQLSKCESLRTIIIESTRPELISEQAEEDILTYFKETGIEIKLENYYKLWKEKGGAIF